MQLGIYKANMCGTLPHWATVFCHRVTQSQHRWFQVVSVGTPRGSSKFQITADATASSCQVGPDKQCTSREVCGPWRRLRQCHSERWWLLPSERRRTGQRISASESRHQKTFLQAARNKDINWSRRFGSALVLIKLLNAKLKGSVKEQNISIYFFYSAHDSIVLYFRCSVYWWNGSVSFSVLKYY